jgi:hypothetical protein
MNEVVLIDIFWLQFIYIGHYPVSTLYLLYTLLLMIFCLYAGRYVHVVLLMLVTWVGAISLPALLQWIINPL